MHRAGARARNCGFACAENVPLLSARHFRQSACGRDIYSLLDAPDFCAAPQLSMLVPGAIQTLPLGVYTAATGQGGDSVRGSIAGLAQLHGNLVACDQLRNPAGLTSRWSSALASLEDLP